MGTIDGGLDNFISVARHKVHEGDSIRVSGIGVNEEAHLVWVEKRESRRTRLEAHSDEYFLNQGELGCGVAEERELVWRPWPGPGRGAWVRARTISQSRSAAEKCQGSSGEPRRSCLSTSGCHASLDAIMHDSYGLSNASR